MRRSSSPPQSQNGSEPRDGHTAELGRDEFQEILKHDDVRSYFHLIGIDLLRAEHLFNALDTDNSNSVTIEEFVVGCMRVRGEAKAVDIATLMQESKRVVGLVSKILNDSNAKYAGILSEIHAEHKETMLEMQTEHKETMSEMHKDHLEVMTAVKARDPCAQVLKPRPPHNSICSTDAHQPHMEAVTDVKAQDKFAQAQHVLDPGSSDASTGSADTPSATVFASSSRPTFAPKVCL